MQLKPLVKSNKMIRGVSSASLPTTARHVTDTVTSSVESTAVAVQVGLPFSKSMTNRTPVPEGSLLSCFSTAVGVSSRLRGILITFNWDVLVTWLSVQAYGQKTTQLLFLCGARQTEM